MNSRIQNAFKPKIEDLKWFEKKKRFVRKVQVERHHSK